MSASALFVHIFDALGWVSIGLLVVLLVLLLLGPFRKYPLILSYCVIQLALTAAENYYIRSKSYSTLYWTDEIVLNLLLFLMVISFTYRALGESPRRAAMGKLLGAVFIVVLSVPFF